MGCGKSSVGRRVAKLLERQFCDLDSYIEQQAGMTVAEIFACLISVTFLFAKRNQYYYM